VSTAVTALKRGLIAAIECAMSLPPLRSTLDLERVIEFEFVRATENAALQARKWLGRGQKELADAAACDAIYGVFDLLDVSAEVVIGEGIKDNAPGIFVGEHLGTWRPGSARFNIALDPIDGTTNVGKGMPNSIAVIAASEVPEGAPSTMKNIPSFYSHKVSYGPAVVEALKTEKSHVVLDWPLEKLLHFVAEALGKHIGDLVVVTMDRPRHKDIIETVRKTGAGLRMISDGDITAAVAPSWPNSGVDLYIGMGGSPEAVLTAAALKCLGGDMQVRMWFQDEMHRAEIAQQVTAEELTMVYRKDDLVLGDSALFCATGITDSALLPGVKLTGHLAETHSILMRARSGTVRHITAVHQLDKKVIPLRGQ
jgi:fructose-1,6-bisphosphatase II